MIACSTLWAVFSMGLKTKQYFLGVYTEPSYSFIEPVRILIRILTPSLELWIKVCVAAAAGPAVGENIEKN
jgi:hypothetical protein